MKTSAKLTNLYPEGLRKKERRLNLPKSEMKAGTLKSTLQEKSVPGVL